MDVAVEIHCAACGSANYSLPDGAADAAAVACNDCGRRLGTIADLKAEMMEQALAHSAEELRRDVDRIMAGKGGLTS
jgi:hypothetical protein